MYVYDDVWFKECTYLVCHAVSCGTAHRCDDVWCKSAHRCDDTRCGVHTCDDVHYKSAHMYWGVKYDSAYTNGDMHSNSCMYLL